MCSSDSTPFSSTSEPQLDPFAPIEANPTSATIGGGAPTSRRVYLTTSTGENDRRLVGTIPAQKLLLSNRDIRTMAQEITGETSFNWATAVNLFDGRHLAYGLVTKDCSVEPVEEDPFSLGLLFQNSYDGSWEPGMRLFAHRQVPATGLLHAQHFGDVRFLSGPSHGGWSTDRRRAEQHLKTAES